MGPTSKRTLAAAAAAASTPKLRSLRIMLLSRSKRRKTRSGGAAAAAAATTKNNNHNHNSNNNNNNRNKKNNTASSVRQVAAATSASASASASNMRGQEKEREKEKLRENKTKCSRSEQAPETNEPKLKTELQELPEQQEQQQTDSQKADVAKQDVSTAKTVSTTITTATTTTATATTTATSVSPQPEKVLYDNRIKRKNVLALNEKVAAIREYEKMPVYKRIGRMFQCSPDQIKRIVQQKDSILNAWEQRTRRCQDAKTLEMKVVRVSMLGKAVYDWIRRMMYYKDFMITDGLIQKMALQFKSAMGLQNFFPHQDWCDKFRQTYNITVNDSKVLSIGYTQGHSVQIKDIMKDVLSECTPDMMGDGAGDEERLGEAPPAKQAKSNKSLKQAKQQQQQQQQQQQHKDESSDETKEMAAPKLCVANRTSTTATAATTTATTLSSISERLITSTVSTVASTSMSMVTTGARRLRQLQLPQLLTLPLKSNNVGGLPQKILVATPITPAGQLGAASPMTMTIIPLATITQPMTSANCGPLVAAAAKRCENRQIVPPPMVEIKREIKEEQHNDDGDDDDDVVDEIDDQQLSSIQTAPTTTPTPAPAPPTSAKVPALEPLRIKQEYISDDDDDGEEVAEPDVENIAAQQVCLKTAAPKAREPSPQADDTMDSLDYDNLALSSLRKIIQSQSASASAGATTTSTTTTKNTTTITTTTTTAAAAAAAAATTVTVTSAAQVAVTSNTNISSTNTKTAASTIPVKPTPTLTLTPIESLRATTLTMPPMVSLSPLARLHSTNTLTKVSSVSSVLTPSVPARQLSSLATTLTPARQVTLLNRNSGPGVPPLALQQLPPLIKAPSSAAISMSTPMPALIPRVPSTPNMLTAASAPTMLPYNHRLAPKRKLRTDTIVPQLPAIKTCGEARKYLKLLEDFALARENFRLIALVTRADEVLRELDGDEDVDID